MSKQKVRVYLEPLALVYEGGSYRLYRVKSRGQGRMTIWPYERGSMAYVSIGRIVNAGSISIISDPAEKRVYHLLGGLGKIRFADQELQLIHALVDEGKEGRMFS